MNAADLVSTAWANLLRRKGRTILTSAGVVVGVSTLVLMVSLGIGLQRQFVSFFESEESLRTLMVNRVPADQKKRGGGGFPFGMMGQSIPLSDKDLDEIRAVPGVESAGPDLNLFIQVSFEAFEGRQPHLVQGVQPADEAIYAKRLKKGRMWTAGEKACLLPSNVLETKMKAAAEDVLDKQVTFRGLMKKEGEEDDVLTCVGVYDSDSFGFRGGYILMPLELGLDMRERKGTILGLPSKRGSYSGAEVRTADPRRVQEVAARLKSAGYGVLSAMEMVKQINVIFLVIEAFLACIGAIGLVVSLFGIANTMAMAVLERTREIGVLKALGARDRDVGRLFLMEAAAIGALGGGTGLALAWVLGKLLNVVSRAAFDVPDRVNLFHVTWWLAAGSVAFAVLVSVIAGTLPARRAAKMEPVAALRFE
ncbi:MAG TPA: FtsX-like permease family protein [Planctomycetota bacterium]